MTDLGLKSFDKLYPMLIHKYKDLIVDQNATEKDKINQIILKLNALGKLSNDVVRDWNTVYQWVMNDGLTQDVNNKLEAMKANGEFDTLVATVVALIGDLTTLETVAKDTVVHSINEVDELAKANQTKIGDLTTLQTADKDTVVHAINDNVVSLGQIATQVKDFATLQTTLTNIGTQLTTLLISNNITITANITIPTNVSLWFTQSGIFTANSGVTVTIQGGITASLYQIFAGSGNFVGTNSKITACYPEWFGGKVNDNTIDNAPFFNLAQNFFPYVKLSIGDYYFNSLFKNIYGSSFEGIGRSTNLGYDLTNIIQQGNYPVIQLDQPMFTLKNVTLKGNTANANNDGILFPSLGSNAKIEQVYIKNCGGHGIHANGSNTYGVDLCEFKNVKCENNVGYGIKLELTPGTNGFNTSKFELVECVGNQLGGFYVDQCSSLVFERCHSFWNESSSNSTTFGYTIGTNNVNNLKFINCWSEQNGENLHQDPSHKSGGFLINGGINLSFDNCRTVNEDRGFNVNGGTNIVIDNPDIGINGYPSCLEILISSSANQVNVRNFNSKNGGKIANFSSSSYIECTNQLPTTGRVPYNSTFKHGQRGKSFGTAQGSINAYDFNATLSAIAGNNYLTWTDNNNLIVGDNILIPGAGNAGGGLFAQITDIDVFNKQIYINQNIVTSITNQVPATVQAVIFTEDYGSAVPTTGNYQVGDRVWNTSPTPSGTLGWVCTTAGTPGTWNTFGTISA